MERIRNIRLVDTTLRDGEQAPGVCFPPDLKVEILKMLYEAGIRDFEIGTPAVNEDEQIAIQQMLALKLNANLSVWCRARLDDLELAHQLGVKMVNLSLPVSRLQLAAIGKDEVWALAQLNQCLEYANVKFDFIAVGAQDGSRADAAFLEKYIETAVSFKNVKRIRLADTVGIMNPFSVYELFSELTQKFPATEFEFHGHNDLGMANANGLAAIKGGADLVSVTVNGLGERCGNTPLEELVLALQYSEEINLKINKRRLLMICDIIATITGRKIWESKPFNGEMCFTHESGIHTRSLITNPLAYQPFRPEDLGRKMTFLFGKHSGKASIIALLTSNHLSYNNEVIQILLNEIKTNKISSSGYAEDDVLALYHRHFTSHIDRTKLFQSQNDWIGLN
ncbi:MAG: hypothetical protein ACERKD_04055 [Prolixibacteraceae bacterium]